MALINKINASSTIEAIVSVAIISSLMVIIFPFFGQVLNSNHRMEMIRGLHLSNELRHSEEKTPVLSGEEEFAGEGIIIRRNVKQDTEIPELYRVTTMFISPHKKIIYTLTEFKYQP